MCNFLNLRHPPFLALSIVSESEDWLFRLLGSLGIPFWAGWCIWSSIITKESPYSTNITIDWTSWLTYSSYCSYCELQVLWTVFISNHFISWSTYLILQNILPNLKKLFLQIILLHSVKDTTDDNISGPVLCCHPTYNKCHHAFYCWLKHWMFDILYLIFTLF